MHSVNTDNLEPSQCISGRPGKVSGKKSSIEDFHLSHNNPCLRQECHHNLIWLVLWLSHAGMSATKVKSGVCFPIWQVAHFDPSPLDGRWQSGAAGRLCIHSVNTVCVCALCRFAFSMNPFLSSHPPHVRVVINKQQHGMTPAQLSPRRIELDHRLIDGPATPISSCPSLNWLWRNRVT